MPLRYERLPDGCWRFYDDDAGIDERGPDRAEVFAMASARYQVAQGDPAQEFLEKAKPWVYWYRHLMDEARRRERLDVIETWRRKLEKLNTPKAILESWPRLRLPVNSDARDALSSLWLAAGKRGDARWKLRLTKLLDTFPPEVENGWVQIRGFDDAQNTQDPIRPLINAAKWALGHIQMPDKRKFRQGRNEFLRGLILLAFELHGRPLTHEDFRELDYQERLISEAMEKYDIPALAVRDTREGERERGRLRRMISKEIEARGLNDLEQMAESGRVTRQMAKTIRDKIAIKSNGRQNRHRE